MRGALAVAAKAAAMPTSAKEPGSMREKPHSGSIRIAVTLGFAKHRSMAMVIIYFPVTSAFYDGLTHTPPGWLDLARTMDASRTAILWRIQVPAAVPSLCSGLRLAAVYAPIGFMTGLIGTLFTEFAFALAGAVVVSGVVALTLSPVLSAKVLHRKGEPGRFESVVERFFERLETTLLQRGAFLLVRLALTSSV